jgi:hypothetical protein
MSKNSNSDNIKFINFDELLTPLASGDYEVEPINGVNMESLSRFVLTDYSLDSIFDNTEITYVGAYPTGLFSTNFNKLVAEDFSKTMTAVGQLLGDENSSNPDAYSKPLMEYRFKRKGKTHGTNIRIVKYPNKEAVSDTSNPININIIDRTLLSELVIAKKTTNILLPIINIVASGSDLSTYDFITEPTVKEEFDLDLKANYLIQLTEKFHSLASLQDYLDNYPLTKKAILHIIYQLADVLSKIHLIYDDFRQNNLVPEMIDVYFEAISQEVLPKIKLSNFYLATNLKNPVAYPNSASIDIYAPDDLDPTYSDMYQILNFFWTHHQDDIKKYADVVTLFNDILPKKIRSDKKTYLDADLWNKLDLENKRMLSADFIKKHKVFTLVNTSNEKPTYPPASSLPDPLAQMARITRQDLEEIGRPSKEVDLDEDDIKIVTFELNDPNSPDDFNDDYEQTDDAIMDVLEQNEMGFETVDDIDNADNDVPDEDFDDTNLEQNESEHNESDRRTRKSQDYDIDNKREMSSKKSSTNKRSNLTDKHTPSYSRTIGSGDSETSTRKSLSGTRIIKKDLGEPYAKKGKSSRPSYPSEINTDSRYAGMQPQSTQSRINYSQENSGSGYSSLGNFLGASQAQKPPGFDDYMRKLDQHGGGGYQAYPSMAQQGYQAPMETRPYTDRANPYQAQIGYQAQHQNSQLGQEDMLARYMAAMQGQGRAPTHAPTTFQAPQPNLFQQPSEPFFQ